MKINKNYLQKGITPKVVYLINKMNPKVLSNRRKSSIGELKVAIKKVRTKQYEKKVKALQQSRNSRSPSVAKKHHSKSRSLLINPSLHSIYTRPEISNTNSEYGLKTPEVFYLEEDVKSLRTENLELKKKLSSIKKDYDMLIIQIRKQLDNDKKAEVNEITKFYIGKITACEEKFELKIWEKVQAESRKAREDTRKLYEAQIKELLAGRFLSNEPVLEQFCKYGKDNYIEGDRQAEMESRFDLEYKVKLILDTKTSEFDRKLGVSAQENMKLRKENESLKQRVLELQAKLDAVSFVNGDKEIGANAGGLSKKYNELLQSYLTLKTEKENQVAVCVKCKAVLSTNDELSKKLLRLREFLSN